MNPEGLARREGDEKRNLAFLSRAGVGRHPHSSNRKKNANTFNKKKRCEVEGLEPLETKRGMG